MHRAVKFQLRAKPGQEALLGRWSGSARWLWNAALARQQQQRADGLPYSNYPAMCKWLTQWRNAPATAWLKLSPVHVQQQVLKRLDAAFQRFFSNVKAGRKAGYPRFKRHGDDPGLRFPDKSHLAFDGVNGRLKLPKLGWVRVRQSRAVTGEIANVSITREGVKWFASIQVEVAEMVPARGLAPSLGIDLGLAQFVATSAGEAVLPLKALARQQRRLGHLQRAVSRKKKGSANRKKAVARLGGLHRRIAHQRADWLHKLTTELADRHPVIALEDLKVRNMSASAKGTLLAPGKQVRQKAGLNRSILDAAWGEFTRQLSYKLEGRAGRVILVNPAYTSQACSACEHVSEKNRKTQSLFSCEACGHTENADINAAKNILAAGHAVWAIEQAKACTGPDACGGDVRRAKVARPQRAAPAKQEPTEATLQA